VDVGDSHLGAGMTPALHLSVLVPYLECLCCFPLSLAAFWAPW
jgi:hypothetical protein